MTGTVRRGKMYHVHVVQLDFRPSWLWLVLGGRGAVKWKKQKCLRHWVWVTQMGKGVHPRLARRCQVLDLDGWMYVQALDCVGRGSGVGCVSKGKYVLRLEIRLQSRDVDNPETYVDDLPSILLITPQTSHSPYYFPSNLWFYQHVVSNFRIFDLTYWVRPAK
jgi:hypothetical protein